MGFLLLPGMFEAVLCFVAVGTVSTSDLCAYVAGLSCV